MSKEDKNNKKKSKETDTNTKKTNRKKTPSTKVIKKENNKNIEEEKVIVKEKIPEKKKYNKWTYLKDAEKFDTVIIGDDAPKFDMTFEEFTKFNKTRRRISNDSK